MNTQQSKHDRSAQRIERGKVVRKQTARIRFWRRVRDYASAQWLRAHGWAETKEGWYLPDWHPKLKQLEKIRRIATKFGRKYGITPEVHHPDEPYDLKHACNSQEAHIYRDNDTRTMVSHQLQDAPDYPAYVRLRPFQWCVITLANFCFAFTNIFSGWLAVGMIAIGVAHLLVAVWMARKARRAWQLDWAEEQLIKRVPNAVHHSN